MASDESAAIVQYTHQPTAIIPRTFAEAKEMAEYLSASALVPAFCRKQPHAVFAMVAAGAEMGLAPMASLRALYVQVDRNGNMRDGVPRMYSDAMVAVCLARPDLCEYFTLIESSDTRATWETKRRGSAPVRRTWDTDRAKKAGLLGNPGPWSAHQPRMLSARAKGELAKDVYPDLVGGFLTPEEDSEIADAAPLAPSDFARPAATPVVVEPPKPPAKAAKVPKAAPPVIDVPAVEVAPPPPVVESAPAPAAVAHYDASAARVAGGEVVIPDEDFDEPTIGEPKTMVDFRAALAAAKSRDELGNVRSLFVPWSNTAEGKPFADAMKRLFGERQAAIKGQAP